MAAVLRRPSALMAWVAAAIAVRATAEASVTLIWDGQGPHPNECGP